MGGRVGSVFEALLDELLNEAGSARYRQLLVGGRVGRLLGILAVLDDIAQFGDRRGQRRDSPRPCCDPLSRSGLKQFTAGAEELVLDCLQDCR